jgi:phage tail-like protein
MAVPEPFGRLVAQTFRFHVELTRSLAVPTPARRTTREARGFVPAASSGEPRTGTVADLLGDGGFQECTGLELEADIKDHLEGGRNDAIIRRVGRVKLQPIVLKRGMFATDQTSQADGGSRPSAVRPELWLWLQGMVSGVLPIPRYNGLIQVMDATNAVPVATWEFDRGLPSKVSGPALNAKTGEIAIEELQIVHEGLRLVPA